jgi:hypothetical protein
MYGDWCLQVALQMSLPTLLELQQYDVESTAAHKTQIRALHNVQSTNNREIDANAPLHTPLVSNSD